MSETYRMHTTPQIGPDTIVRRLKLGKGNKWAAAAIEAGELVFGDPCISHEAAMAKNWDAIWNAYRATTTKDGVATNWTRELVDFYTLGEECLWVTFYGGLLYWAFAAPGVSFNAALDPPRRRKTVDGWHCTDLKGEKINSFALSSAITQTATAQTTICEPSGWKLYLALIRGEANPLVAIARQQEAALAETATGLIETLHQTDLEILAQRIAEAMGWRIQSAIGGKQAGVDFIARLPALDLAGYFQVKATASQAGLDDFLEAVSGVADKARCIFVTHNLGRLKVKDRTKVEIWAGQDLALKALRAGLLPWIIERSQ